MKHASYKELDCCGTCKHVYEWWDYDCDDVYYCHRDGSNRPLCGSSALNESKYSEDWMATPSKIVFDSKVWRAWANPRGVEFNGWCEEFTDKE